MFDDDDKPAALALARLDRMASYLWLIVVLLIGLALANATILYMLIRIYRLFSASGG